MPENERLSFSREQAAKRLPSLNTLRNAITVFEELQDNSSSTVSDKTLLGLTIVQSGIEDLLVMKSVQEINTSVQKRKRDTKHELVTRKTSQNLLDTIKVFDFLDAHGIPNSVVPSPPLGELIEDDVKSLIRDSLVEEYGVVRKGEIQDKFPKDNQHRFTIKGNSIMNSRYLHADSRWARIGRVDSDLMGASIDHGNNVVIEGDIASLIEVRKKSKAIVIGHVKRAMVFPQASLEVIGPVDQLALFEGAEFHGVGDIAQLNTQGEVDPNIYGKISKHTTYKKGQGLPY